MPKNNTPIPLCLVLKRCSVWKVQHLIEQHIVASCNGVKLTQHCGANVHPNPVVSLLWQVVSTETRPTPVGAQQNTLKFDDDDITRQNPVQKI